MESSSGIEKIFNFKSANFSLIYNQFSHLFIDPDKKYDEISPQYTDGVIKSKLSMGKNVFMEDAYPDEIAISNILKRYYFAWLKKVDSLIKTMEPDIVFICRSHTPVSHSESGTSGIPSPIVKLGKCPIDSHRDLGVLFLAENLGKRLSRECDSIGKNFDIHNISDSFLYDHFSSLVPVIELSITKSLYINDDYFDLNTLSINENRLKYLSKIIEGVFVEYSERFAKRG